MSEGRVLNLFFRPNGMDWQGLSDLGTENIIVSSNFAGKKLFPFFLH